MNTLLFGIKAKNIKINYAPNIAPADINKKLMLAIEEIKKLKKELQMHQNSIKKLDLKERISMSPFLNVEIMGNNNKNFFNTENDLNFKQNNIFSNSNSIQSKCNDSFQLFDPNKSVNSSVSNSFLSGIWGQQYHYYNTYFCETPHPFNKNGNFSSDQNYNNYLFPNTEVRNQTNFSFQKPEDNRYRFTNIKKFDDMFILKSELGIQTQKPILLMEGCKGIDFSCINDLQKELNDDSREKSNEKKCVNSKKEEEKERTKAYLELNSKVISLENECSQKSKENEELSKYYKIEIGRIHSILDATEFQLDLHKSANQAQSTKLRILGNDNNSLRNQLTNLKTSFENISKENSILKKTNLDLNSSKKSSTIIHESDNISTNSSVKQSNPQFYFPNRKESDHIGGHNQLKIKRYETMISKLQFDNKILLKEV